MTCDRSDFRAHRRAITASGTGEGGAEREAATRRVEVRATAALVGHAASRDGGLIWTRVALDKDGRARQGRGDTTIVAARAIGRGRRLTVARVAQWSVTCDCSSDHGAFARRARRRTATSARSTRGASDGIAAAFMGAAAGVASSAAPRAICRRGLRHRGAQIVSSGAVQGEERERGNELGGFHRLALEDCVAGGALFFACVRIVCAGLPCATDSVLEARGLRCGERAVFATLASYNCEVPLL